MKHPYDPGTLELFPDLLAAPAELPPDAACGDRWYYTGFPWGRGETSGPGLELRIADSGKPSADR